MRNINTLDFYDNWQLSFILILFHSYFLYSYFNYYFVILLFILFYNTIFFL